MFQRPAGSADDVSSESGYLLTELLALNKNMNTVKKRAKLIFASIEKDLDNVVKFLDSVSTHIEQLTEKSAEDTDLKDFAAYLSEIIKKLKNLMYEANRPGGASRHILHALNNLILSIPDLLEAVQRLDLGKYTQGMPTSFDVMQQAVAKKISALAAQQLPSIFRIIVDHAETVMSDEPDKIDQFMQLDPFVRTLDLTVLGTLVSELSKLVVLLDKLEIEYSFREGVLLENISFQIPFKPEGKGLMTLKQLCEKVSHGYEERMRLEGYSLEACVETYPYLTAKLKSRKSQLDVIQQEEAIRQQRQLDWLQRNDKDNAELIDQLIQQYKTEHATKHQDKITVLNILSVAFDRPEARQWDFESTLQEVQKDTNSKKILEKNAPIKTLIENIRENNTRLRTQIEHSQKKVGLLQKRLVFKIQAVEEQIAARNTDHPRTYHDANVDMQQITQALITQANKTVKIVEELMLGNKATPAPALASSASTPSLPMAEPTPAPAYSALNTAQEYMDRIESELQKAIDSEIFNRYFTLSATDTIADSAAHAWIEELGNVFKAIKILLARLKVLQQEYIRNKQQITNARPADETPASRVLGLLSITNQCTDDLARLVQSLKQFSFHPVIAGLTPASVKKKLADKTSELQMLSLQVGQLPVVRYLRTHTDELVGGFGGSNKVDFMLKKLEDFYSYASEKFTLDNTARLTITKTLAHIKKVREDANTQLPDEKNSKGKILAYTLKHLVAIASIVANISSVKDSLIDATIRESLDTLQRLNLLFRDICLFVDNLEIEFFLQTGYILKLSVDDTSLHALMEKFHHAIDSAGYEFKPEERFPYTHAIHKQRACALRELQDADTDSDPVTIEFLTRRVQESSAPVASTAMLDAPAEPAVAEVQHEDDQIVPLLDVLSEVEPTTAEENQTVKSPILSLIDNCLAELKSKRSHKVVIHRLQMEESIFGLTQLRQVYQQSGYSMREALDEVKEKYLSAYQAMVAHEPRLIADIKAQDTAIPSAARGKKLIDFNSSHLGSTATAENSQSISRRMQELNTEIETSCLPKKTARVKLHLLTVFNNNITKMPFADAVNEVRKTNPDTYHKLFSGRTGERVSQVERDCLGKRGVR